MNNWVRRTQNLLLGEAVNLAFPKRFWVVFEFLKELKTTNDQKDSTAEVKVGYVQPQDPKQTNLENQLEVGGQ